MPTSPPDIWRSHQEAVSALDTHGCGGAVERAAERGIPGTGFRIALERALLESWLERRLDVDTRLRPPPAIAAERDELVREFRRLDGLLVETAYAQVIEACNQRRPRPGLGQTQTIQAEANKKARHKPVRLLLEETRSVTPLLKPCMMMSP
ncbi:hypothetical protein [Actinomadura flavalba]|uniref:hypothetical protein n=1 Tax=Actinomadura flavalba TaxID=1120938 RepID=UPI000362F9BC|nr:hypothetical protein [Actinomadura flavalba]